MGAEWGPTGLEGARIADRRKAGTLGRMKSLSVTMYDHGFEVGRSHDRTQGVIPYDDRDHSFLIL